METGWSTHMACKTGGGITIPFVLVKFSDCNAVLLLKIYGSIFVCRVK